MIRGFVARLVCRLVSIVGAAQWEDEGDDE